MKARGRLSLLLVVLVVVTAALGVAYLWHPAQGPPSRAATPVSKTGPRHPIVLIGLDGADWQIIEPLAASGRLPNLFRLKARSTWGHLRSSEPILSPLLWTTAATGKPPDEHGIIDFLVPDPATRRRVPISSKYRRVKALWNIFSDRGLSADVIAWWASWPAERINGRIVSDRVAYSLFRVPEEQEGLTHPDSLWRTLRSDVVRDDAIGFADVARFLDVSREEFDAARRRARLDPDQAYKEPINHLTKILASTRTYHDIALRLLGDGQADLLAIYYQGIDEVCHRFAHFMPPRMNQVSESDFARYSRAVEEFYVYQDELLGDLLAHTARDSTVLVMSDHGFLSGPSRPTDGPADIEGKPGKWHRLYGIVLVSGEGVRPGRLDTATLLDIAPTVLALAGLPIAADMKGTSLVTAPAGGAPATIASYEGEGSGTGPQGDRGGAGATSEADEELLRNLASLGYIGAGGAQPDSASVESPPPAAVPETVTAQVNLASLLLQKGDLVGAERLLRQAIALKPGSFAALMSLSQVLVRQGKIEEALYATRRAVAESQDAEQGAYLQLAILAARAGQASQAASFLTALKARRPTAAGIETALGLLEADAGRDDAAERRYRAALTIDPASAEALGRLFHLYRQAGREAELEGEVRRGLERNDRSVLHHNWLGLILAGRGDVAAAESEYARALELAPDFGGTMANLGALYGRTGRLEQAVTVLARALRIEPNNLEAQVNLGAGLAKLGRLDEAIANLEQARDAGLRTPDLLNAIGLAYAQKGRTREAIEALEESLTASPDQPDVRSLLSDLKRPA